MMSHFRHKGVLMSESKHHGGYAVPAAGVDGAGHARRPRSILAAADDKRRRFYALRFPSSLAFLSPRQSYVLRAATAP